MFEQAYYSIYHHPLVMWAVGGAVIAALLVRGATRKGLFGALLILFQIEILVDAWMTGGLKPFADGSSIATAAAIVFVILGDLRYFVLLERFGNPKPQTLTRWLLLPIAYSLAVPIASNVAAVFWPDNSRALFLTYEAMFFVVAIFIRVAILPRRANDATWNTFAEKLTHFEIVQYALWASADVVILTAGDIGYLFRLVPNLMYYTAFVPFAWKVAPSEIRP